PPHASLLFPYTTLFRSSKSLSASAPSGAVCPDSPSAPAPFGASSSDPPSSPASSSRVSSDSASTPASSATASSTSLSAPAPSGAVCPDSPSAPAPFGASSSDPPSSSTSASSGSVRFFASTTVSVSYRVSITCLAASPLEYAFQSSENDWTLSNIKFSSQIVSIN